MRSSRQQYERLRRDDRSVAHGDRARAEHLCAHGGAGLGVMFQAAPHDMRACRATGPRALTSRRDDERVLPRVDRLDALHRQEDEPSSQRPAPANGEDIDAVEPQADFLDDPAAVHPLDAKADGVQKPVATDRALRAERLLVLEPHRLPACQPRRLARGNLAA